MQAVAADVAGSGSRWQQAGSGSKQAGLVTRQDARHGAKMARNAKCASLVAMVLGRVRQAAAEQSSTREEKKKVNRTKKYDPCKHENESGFERQLKS